VPQPAVPRAKATPADINEPLKPKIAPVVDETPSLPPLVRAAQQQATSLYSDNAKLADAFLEGVAFEIEGRKFDLTPVGKDVRSARKVGAEWFKTNGATLDTMPAAPEPMATPEPPGIATRELEVPAAFADPVKAQWLAEAPERLRDTYTRNPERFDEAIAEWKSNTAPGSGTIFAGRDYTFPEYLKARESVTMASMAAFLGPETSSAPPRAPQTYADRRALRKQGRAAQAEFLRDPPIPPAAQEPGVANVAAPETAFAPAAEVQSYSELEPRLAQLDRVAPDEAQQLRARVDSLAGDPNTMLTPPMVADMLDKKLQQAAGAEPGPRYKEGDAPTGPTLPVAEVDRIARATLRGMKGAPDIQVVDTSDSPLLPESYRKREKFRGVTSRAGDKIYIVADQHMTPSQVRSTVFHEALGHAGLAQAFKKAIYRVLAGMYNTNPKMRQAADAWLDAHPNAYKNLTDNMRRLRAVEEVMANGSEGGIIRLPYIRRAYAAIKDVIRQYAKKINWRLSYSDADVMAVIAKAHEQIESGTLSRPDPQQSESDTDPRFMDAEDAPPAPPPPGGPTDAPPSTPNAPLGGKVEIAARLQPFFDDLTRKFNYKYQDAEVTQRAALGLLGLDKFSEDKDFAQSMRLYDAAKGGKQEVLDRQHIKPLENAIKASGLDINDIGMYLWARSTPARNAMIAAINGEFPDGGSGLTNAEAQQVMADLAARGLTPKLEAIAARADKLVDHMLKLRVEAGLLTQADVDAMRAEQPFYMPLKGFAKDGDMQTDDTKNPHEKFEQGKTARSAVSEFRKAKGRKSMPFNPLLNLIVDASYATLRADTNEVGKTFLNALRAHPDEFKRVATFWGKGKPKLKYSDVDPLTGKRTAFPENLRMQTDELMTVKDGGELYFIEFADTDEGAAMRRAFSNMRPEQMGKFMKGLTATTRTLKQLLTTRSPSYMAGPAFIRDMMDSYTSAVAAMTKKGGPAYGKPLAQAMRKHISPRTLSSVAGYAFGKGPKTLEQALDQMLLEQMVSDGGSVGHSLIKSVETYAEDAAKRLQRHAKAKEGDLLAATRENLGAVGEALDATAQMYDLMGRFATYKGALELGISRKDAAELALDASLNLTRRGEWSGVLDSLFFFFSPTIEGARKFKNMGLSGRNGIKVMTSFAGIGTALTLWNLMMSGDEDDDGRPDYLDINDMTRQTRAIVYYGNGPDDYVTMPLGFMGAYPQYVGSRIAEAAYGANNEESASALIMGATADLGRGLFSAMSPVRPSGSSAEDTAGSVMPSAVKPFFDLTLNRNFFDTPIYNKQFDARRARSTLGRENTEQFWHWMARSMNEMTGGSGTVAGSVDFQPEVYRYIVESFGGGPYRFLRDTMKTPERVEEDGVARALPLVRGFVGKGFEYVPMSNYYKHVNDLDAILWQEKNGTDEEWEKTRAARPVNTDPRVLDAYEAAKRELDGLARARREELKEEADTEERRAIVDFYREEGQGAYEEFNRVREAVRKELGK
jgi:hypothetical protein